MDDTASTDQLDLAAGNGSGDATARDVQRRALSDLISLLMQCARRETTQHTEHVTNVEAAEKDLDRAKLKIDHLSTTSRAEIEKKVEARRVEIAARHAEDVAGARQQFEQRRTRAETDFVSLSRQLKDQLQQAVWLADSVNDATQGAVKRDSRKARDTHEADNVSLDELVTRMVETVIRFGQPPPELPVPASAEAPPPAEGVSATDHFATLREAARDRLRELRELALPGLLVGLLPWLVALILLGGFGFAGNFFLADRMPQWKAIGGAVGAGIVFLTILGIALKMLANRQVRRAVIPLRSALADARAGADAKLRATKEALAAQAAKANAARDVETRAAQDKHDPLLARAKSSHDSSIAAAQKELDARLRHADERRDRHSAELVAWQEKSTADLTVRVERELSLAGERHTTRAASIEQGRREAESELIRCWNEGLRTIQGSVPTAGHGNGALLDWSDDSVTRWQPSKSFPSTVRFGSLRVDAHQLLRQLPPDARFSLQLPESFDLPAVLALPRQASLLIEADRAGRPAAIATLQMLMTRLLTSVPPGRAKFTIFDPVALGQNFAGFMHLADHDETLVGTRIWTDAEHIDQRLADLTEHMETVIQKYLRNEFQTIDEYNAQAGELAEPYRFLVVSDFPHGFQNESFRRLASIASTGARCGVYTLVFRDRRMQIPAGSGVDDVEAHSVHLVQADEAGQNFTWRDKVFEQFPLTLDTPPDEATLTKLMHKVGRLAKEANRVEVPFESIAPREEEFWTLSAKSELRVPIGRMGATRQQQLRLGKGVAQHALIAGKTGSGKSTLLHAIIANAAMWYSPAELELYLIDFKKGVEFKTYATHNLPHARAIAVESDREFGLSVLQRIDAEMTRRGEMYRKLGVQDLAAFRDGAPGETMPRILLIIDEFQEFFSEDDKLAQDAALLLDRLVRQGRAFGIHTLLGSQTIGGSSGLSRSTIGQMAVRVALQTSEADSQLILGDNNSAARLLSRPGEAIYNDGGGLVENNSPFQVAWLSDDRRDRFLEAVNRKLEASKVAAPPSAIVFEGNAPADITRNRQLSQLLTKKTPPPAVPRAFLGDPVAIKDPTHIAFRRQAGANALLVGQQEESAIAMAISSIVSLAAYTEKDRAKFVILDGTPVDSPLHGRMAELKSVLPHEVRIVEYRETEAAMAELGQELTRRRETDDVSAPAVFVFILGMQRYRALRKSEDSFSFSSEEGKLPSADKLFAELLKEGPSVGMHVFAWADTAVSVDRTIERSLMREFDHRILMQMSANDSSLLIDSPAANKLGFYRAIAFSEEQGVMEKFRPYAVAPKEWLTKLWK